MQLANPPRTNPPVTPGHDLMAANPPPPAIAAMLHAACYDCHSDETKWPWYSHVAPVSWLVAGDVKDGRERMNFSEWPRDLPERAAKRLERISEEVGYKDMPPAKYTLLHPEARLTPAQRQQLIGLGGPGSRPAETGTGKQIVGDLPLDAPPFLMDAPASRRPVA